MSFLDWIGSAECIEILRTCATSESKSPIGRLSKMARAFEFDQLDYVTLDDNKKVIGNYVDREALVTELISTIWEQVYKAKDRDSIQKLETIISGVQIIRNLLANSADADLPEENEQQILKEAFSLVSNRFKNARIELKKPAQTLLNPESGNTARTAAGNILISLLNRFLVEGCLEIFHYATKDFLRGAKGDPFNKLYKDFVDAINKYSEELYMGGYGYLLYSPAKRGQKGSYYAFSDNREIEYACLSLERFNDEIMLNLPNPSLTLSQEDFHKKQQFTLAIAELAWEGLLNVFREEIGMVPIYALVNYTAQYFNIADIVINSSSLDEEDDEGQLESMIENCEKSVFTFQQPKHVENKLILIQDVRTILDELDEDEHTAVVMANSGHVLREIAAKFNCSITNASNILDRAYAKLSKRLGEKKSGGSRNI